MEACEPLEGPWLISYLVLWVVVLLLGAAVLAHSRLLGLLHHRFGPAQARQLSDGPKIGTRMVGLAALDLDGQDWQREFPAAAETWLAFISPQCHTCNEFVPHLLDFARAHPELSVVAVSMMDDLAMNRAYVAHLGFGKTTYLLGERLAEAMEVEGAPYVVRIDPRGLVIAKGLANNYEHLVSLQNPPAL